jgi:membrane-bound ClpP family serine protease
VRIEGELWNARSENGPIDAGIDVIVVSQNGLKVVVRPKQHNSIPDLERSS